MDSQAANIVKWAEDKAKPNCKPKIKRLSQVEVGLLLQMHKAGKTQAEIAQQLGISQQAVSKWLDNTTDSTDLAKLYLRGSALRMAQNIVHKGRAADHIKALEGVNVLAPEHTGNIVVQIGIKADSIKLIPSTFASKTSTVSTPQGQLSADTGSDN